jgi:hypothetical protein
MGEEGTGPRFAGARDRGKRGSKVARTHSVTVRLSEEEFEWVRRKAHWGGTPIGGLLRAHIHQLIAEEGYLRPPDDEPQDFGYEKEMMQFVVRFQRESD